MQAPAHFDFYDRRRPHFKLDVSAPDTVYLYHPPIEAEVDPAGRRPKTTGILSHCAAQPLIKLMILKKTNSGRQNES